MPACILVVDDEPSVVNLIAYNLRKAHYQVLTASDGRDALNQAWRSQPDLILLVRFQLLKILKLDWELPEMILPMLLIGK